MVAISIPASVALAFIQFWAAVYISRAILWQDYLVLLLAGRGPILGYDVNGNPLYEATPVHFVAFIFAMFVSIVIYAILIYFLLKRARHNKSHKRTE